ncbi:uncharacterized protein Pyn_28046 [Prunus yedoensis var. nudiflora]|uniref:Serine/arginine repetitive matrix protein 2 n=1 Tax=Prunus yedoensis var. nudiflora TaxID=2094558 RepID=A0A314ZCD2_PRUYE|nr:uncharacterized protein Pyn_28046 [Prunus yedoensis var. nudiflora]
MGTCFSKKKRSSSPLPLPLPPPAATGYGYVVGEDPNDNKNKPKSVSVVAEPGRVEMKAKKPERKQEQIEEEEEDQETQVQVKKEVFIIKHRKSHDGRGDRDCGKSSLPQNQIQQQPSVSDGGADVAAASASPPVPQIANSTAKTGTCNELVDDVDKVVKRVRTQSCNKEELDAILLQCGRLSRSNSSGHNRRYSGSKRSYDFDAVDGHVNVNEICHEDADADGADEMSAADKIRRHRQSSRSRPSSPSSQGRRRRRTPSRERNQQQQQQQRSSSRERRTSRSPSKRSSSQQNPSASSSSNANANANGNNRPGKMVSVPAAAISSVAMVEKTTHINNGESAATIKRISVKRNVGSPRAQSPARANARGAPNEGQQQQQPSLSRSSSRKAEQSPYRRNPLAEIDPNSLAYPQPHTNNKTKREIQTEEDIPVKEPTNLLNQAPMQKPNLEINNNRTVPHGVNYITSGTSTMDSNKAMSANCSSKERQQNVPAEEAKGQPQGKPQTLTRSRSSRRSRDLDFDPETATLSNPAAPSLYTSLLLQDIHNFHQQNTPNVVSVPPCVTKACSILEAVADLNSATKSTLTDQLNKKATPGSGYNCSLNANYNVVGKSIADQPKDPFVESEVVVNDDLMEPSFHKYVTVRRGTGALEGGGILDMEDQESSGSNSFVSGTSHSQQHHWGLSSSSWEPNSADSTDSWTSRSNTREEGPNHRTTPLSFDLDEAAKRRLSGRKRDSDDHHQRNGGIGRGRLAATNTKGLHTIPGVAAAASM